MDQGNMIQGTMIVEAQEAYPGPEIMCSLKRPKKQLVRLGTKWGIREQRNNDLQRVGILTEAS
jgi:hypothetical protein